ncbi:hypothetical protein A1O1_00582 [Capronia coronata CBS 617.96]|uniref:Uncharacterized protein n=1 Tax=Capronia coronata CBS 617.96 TaxID=1182541 RepID=W9Z0K6_9EURO|nr:uncharacterized protein A1O1_00582 [Capronia coronata CBS 617.96]EXJ95460.1 hypothetical protein A1O1_00582 [Capronia coronata CBS 617.96]
MNQGFSAASCVSHQGPRFVWISDALLADTFNRFCHHKRYGSSVPGPLEAQRRATKRKNTSLARYGQGGGPRSIDPSLVLGSTSQINWWQPPAPAEAEASGSRLLPSWLFSESTQVAKNAQNSNLTSAEASDRKTALQTRQGYVEEAQLGQCRSLAEIRIWLKDQGLNIRDNVRIGERISQYLLTGDFDGSEIAAYLCDPAFHPPGTSFHRQMLPTLLAQSWDFRSWHAIRRSYCKAAELGLLGVADLRAVIARVADAGPMTLVKDNGELQIVKSIEREHFIHDMLTSLAHSRVLTLVDLGHDFLSHLLRKVGTARRLTATSQRIMWDLLPWASARDAPLISRLIMMHLRTRCRDDPSEEVGQKLAERLSRVDLRVLQLALVQSTHELVRVAQEDPKSTYVYLFYHWTGTLACLGSRRNGLSLTKDVWTSFSTTASTLSAEQRLLVFAWTSLCLGKRRRTSHVLSERMEFLESFDQTIQSILELADDGLLHRAILTLGSLPLPNQTIPMQNLSRLDARDRLPIVPEPGSAPALDGLQRQSFSLFLDDDLYEDARLNHSDVLSELAESLNHDLPLFKTLSRRMIQKNPLSFEIISRILENNLPFKLALSQAFPQQLRAVQRQLQPPLDEVLTQVTSSSSRVGGKFDAQNNLQKALVNMPHPEEALDFLNNLAVWFATSPVTSPRASLRRVYWCYTFLHRYGGPIQPTVTRALWHVAVTRYGESGTSRTLLRWVLWQVKQTEGESVARTLLWSQSLRERWQQHLEDLGRVDLGEEKQLLAEFASGEDADRSPDTPCVPAHLETLRKIRFARTEPEERIFFFEKTRRRADWERFQAKRAMASKRSSDVDERALAR